MTATQITGGLYIEDSDESTDYKDYESFESAVDDIVAGRILRQTMHTDCAYCAIAAVATVENISFDDALELVSGMYIDISDERLIGFSERYVTEHQ